MYYLQIQKVHKKTSWWKPKLTTTQWTLVHLALKDIKHPVWLVRLVKFLYQLWLEGFHKRPFKKKNLETQLGKISDNCHRLFLCPFTVLPLLHTRPFLSGPRAGGEPCLTLWCLRLDPDPPSLSPVLRPPHHHHHRRSFLQLAGCLDAANNSLFCGVPCERRHSLSQGRGARGDCWPRASRAGHTVDSSLGAPVPHWRQRKVLFFLGVLFFL